MTDQTTGHTRVALVTGATSGIGRAVALKLASDGFAVVVHGRDAERGAATVRAIEEAGGHARFASADLGNPDEVARLADDAGEVDVFVNNAGFSWFGATADLDVATFDALFASNGRACEVQAQDSGAAQAQDRAMDMLWRWGSTRSSAIDGEMRRERRRWSRAGGVMRVVTGPKLQASR